MRFGDRLAVNITPLFLRLVLAATFILAGAGKLFGTIEVTGGAAAILANEGVTLTPVQATTTPVSLSLAGGQAEGQPEDAAEPGMPVPPPLPEGVDGDEAEDAAESFAPVEDDADAAAAPDPDLVTAADFPGDYTARGLYGVALLMISNSTPVTRVDGTETFALVPTFAVENGRAVILAWVAAVSEFAFGVLLVVGFLSRLGGLSLAGTMVVAMWLTEIGPAIQSGDTVLGFLPGLGGVPWFDAAKDVWVKLLWQFSLFCAGMALFFSGSGTLALERIFRSKPADDGEDE